MKILGIRNLFTVVAGLASIIGIGLGGYQLGKAGSNSDSKNFEIRVQNTLESVVNELPQEKRQEAQSLLKPISDLVSAVEGADGQAIASAKNSISHALISKTLVSYHADKSPFVPPLDKAQYLCNEEFLLTYKKQYGTTSNFAIGTDKKSLGALGLSPGVVQSVKSDQATLTLTVLEYQEEFRGPLLKYSCGS